MQIDNKGNGVNMMQPLELLAWGDTRSWYEALWQCQEKEGKADL